ncbi:MAG: methyltransferase domain-containing protein [Acidipila sp.]|nr:methyltransferase domain-containing protein [Acidipila sp.]
MNDLSREERWQSERNFFDSNAAVTSRKLAPTDPLAVARYGASRPRRRFNKEFRFRVLADLRGKKVLDVGCGEGSNSILLTKLGAAVTGIDISAESIKVAEKRAQLDGVHSTIHFLCAPVEIADLAPQSFDMIWGDAILHHLIAELDMVMSRLVSWAKPGALMLFAEPVNLNHTLRRVRFMVPVKTDATPDERPLEVQEIKIIRRHLHDVKIRHFALLGRLDRFILPNHNYERSALPRRALSNAIASVDYCLLSLPWVKNLGGTAVIYGHTQRSPGPPSGGSPQ